MTGLLYQIANPRIGRRCQADLQSNDGGKWRVPKFRLTPEEGEELQRIFEGREDAKRPTLPTWYPAEVIEVVEHAARLNCHCQMNANDCEINRHWPSCIVGKAQKLLGVKVTIKAG
jgi:hypothetical protein